MAGLVPLQCDSRSSELYGGLQGAQALTVPVVV